MQTGECSGSADSGDGINRLPKKLCPQPEPWISKRFFAAFIVFLLAGMGFAASAQSLPDAPDHPWHAPAEQSAEQQASRNMPPEAAVKTLNAYSLDDLINVAEEHNPDTRVAWESARARAAALGIARSELYPTLVAAALSQTNRMEVYLNTQFYRQTVQSFDLALELNYTIFDFGARRGRINTAAARLLAANFAFNDVQRALIYQVSAAYYQLLNAQGQVEAAQANLANAQAVQDAAQVSLKNGLATLPDVLEAKSATAEAEYDLQATLGAQAIAHGDLAKVMGVSPDLSIPVTPIEKLMLPESVSHSVDEDMARAMQQRPDLMKQLEAIRAAQGEIKTARSAYFPTLSMNVKPDAQDIYGLQQQLPWGHTAALDGGITLNLHWTVFDGGLRKNTLAQARANEQVATAQAGVLRDQIEDGIWTAYSNLQTAFRQRQAAEAFLTASITSYNAAIESYHYGVRNLLDVTAAQKTLARARSTDILARAQVLTALADLEFETGDSIQSPAGRTQP